MDKQKIFFWVRLILLVVLSLVVVFLIANSRGFSMGHPFSLNARYLSDGFFVVGFMLTGVGLLTRIASTGIFDIFSYAMHSLVMLFSPLRRPEEHPSFYDYKLQRAEKRRKPGLTVLLTGISGLLLSVLFLALYYR